MNHNYYYNPHRHSGSKSDPDRVDPTVAESYINGNKRLKKDITYASNKFGVSISTLRATLFVIFRSGIGCATTASQKLIAEKVGASLRTVSTAIKSLRWCGAIKVFHRYTKIKETRRRTSSITIFKALQDHINWLRIKRPPLNANFAQQKKLFIMPDNILCLDASSGEILSPYELRHMLKI